MAIAAAPGDEARLCGNCKKDIPAVNFLTHEIHCRRNIEICPFCSDSVPKSEMKNHVESEHVQVTCKCRMKMENSLLKEHEASACPLRRCPCRFCDIPLAAGELDEHESYCGARTERCARCGHHVLLRDRPEHPRHCGTRPAPPTGPEGTAEPRGKGDELEKKEIPDSSLPEEWSADLDYVLALSLQDENNPPQNTAAGIPRDLWEYDCPEEPRPSAHLGTEPILLPCEFCEQLCPAEELILHQTGCNPASAFASFSKRSSSPKPWEFDAVGAVGSNSSRTPPASQPQIGQAEGDILIPCEFCGIQLEEQVLFHHQHYCDQRPASPAPATAPDRRHSPERHSPERRHSRHQGDVSPGHAEGRGQPGLDCPAQGTKLRSDMASARSAPLAGSAGSGAAPGQPRKGSGSKGRAKAGGAGAAAGGTTPRARPAQHQPGHTFTSSFSRAPPAQPSPSTGGRSLRLQDGRVGLRRRSNKAKAQNPGAGSPEE